MGSKVREPIKNYKTFILLNTDISKNEESTIIQRGTLNRVAAMINLGRPGIIAYHRIYPRTYKHASSLAPAIRSPQLTGIDQYFISPTRGMRQPVRQRPPFPQCKTTNKQQKN